MPMLLIDKMKLLQKSNAEFGVDYVDRYRSLNRWQRSAAYTGERQ
jgi:hypothetical protein